jgi:hypothetical protein
VAVLTCPRDGTRLSRRSRTPTIPTLQRAHDIIAAIDDVLTDRPELHDDCLEVGRSYYGTECSALVDADMPLGCAVPRGWQAKPNP